MECNPCIRGLHLAKDPMHLKACQCYCKAVVRHIPYGEPEHVRAERKVRDHKAERARKRKT